MKMTIAVLAAMTAAGGTRSVQTHAPGAVPVATDPGTPGGGPLVSSSAKTLSGSQTLSGTIVDPRDFPDPFVLRAGGTYFAFGSNAGATNVQVMSSTDLVNWQIRPDALPNLPRWAARRFTWSPAVLARGDRYVLYYTVRDAAAGRQAISVAYSSSPGGPYVDASPGPLICQLSLGGSIDDSPFVDADGRAYLLWKADSNVINRPSSLWIQSLSGMG
jgi:beta-xylosidase